MKKIIINLIFVIVVIALFSFESVADGGDVGTTSANFLKIGVGVKAVAMGEAFTALADDGSSIYWNPAGITQINNRQFFATYNTWFQSVSQGYLSYILPFGENTVGFALNYVDMGTIQGYDEAGFPTHQFGASNLLFQIAYAKKMATNFSLGISVGYLSDTIENSKESSYLGTAGILIKPGSNFSLGLAIQNLGGDVRNDPLPIILKAGVGVKTKTLTFTADIGIPNDNNIYYCAGLEWWLGEIFALRVGYRTNQDNGPGYTAGIGFKTGNSYLDYAYAPYGNLGTTHRISWGINL